MKPILLTAFAVLMLAGCGGSDTHGGKSASAASAVPKAAASAASTPIAAASAPAAASAAIPASAPASAALASKSASAVSAASMKVQTASAHIATAANTMAPECEAMMRRMTACYSKLPDDAAAPMKATLDETRETLLGVEGPVCKSMNEGFDATAATLRCE